MLVANPKVPPVVSTAGGLNSTFWVIPQPFSHGDGDQDEVQRDLM